jgi:hypothetical protein
MVSCLAGANPHFSITFPLVFFVNELTLFYLVDDIQTLVNVSIIDSIWANLVSQEAFALGVVVIVVA